MNKSMLHFRVGRSAFRAVLSLAVINLAIVGLSGCGKKEIPPPIQGQNAHENPEYRKMQEQAAKSGGSSSSGSPSGSQNPGSR